MMRLIINIPDPPKDQCLIDISFHFQEGQLVEYTAPSGWSVKEQPKEEREAFDMAVNALSAMDDIQGVIRDMKVILHMDGEAEE